jgi:hypothetical protein
MSRRRRTAIGKTTTSTAALRSDGIAALMVLDGPT